MTTKNDVDVIDAKFEEVKENKTPKPKTKWQKFLGGVQSVTSWIWRVGTKVLGVIAMIFLVIFTARMAVMEFPSSPVAPVVTPVAPVVTPVEPVVAPPEVVAQAPAVVAPPEASAPVTSVDTSEVEVSALEAPDQRSAASNHNFIGYFGSRGKGWKVPEMVLDTNGQDRKVGSVIHSWCLTEKECYYAILLPGDIISEDHGGSQINIYSPDYTGQEPNELQYIQTHSETKWTKVIN